MFLQFIRRCGSMLLRIVSDAAPLVSTGAMLGQIGIVWTSLAGTTPSAMGVLLLSLCSGLLLSRTAGQHLTLSSLSSSSGWIGRLAVSATASVLVLLLIWLMPVLLSESFAAGSRQFAESPGTLKPLTGFATWLSMSFAAVVLSVLTATVVIWSRLLIPDDRPASAATGVWLSLGSCLLLLHAVASLPLAITATICVVVTMLLHGLRVTVGPEYSGSGSAADRRERRATLASMDSAAWNVALPAMATGVQLLAVSDLLQHLMPFNVPLILLSLLITSCLVWLGTLRTWPETASQRPFRILALACIGSLPILFSTLTDLNLWLKATVSSAVLAIFLRALQVSVFAAAAVWPLFLPSTPTGRTRRRVDQQVRSGQDGSDSRLATTMNSAIPERHPFIGSGPETSRLTGMVGGFLLALLAMTYGQSSITLLFCGTAMTAVVMIISWLTTGATWDDAMAAAGMRWIPRGRLSAAVALAIACPMLVLPGSVDTSRSTQLLFSARSVVALKLGMEPELIPQSDASRLVASARTSRGQLDVWHRNGHVFEFCRRGVSLGQISSDPRLTPQPVADIFPAIIPLVAHPSPDRILLLGDETGACLRVCSHFPAQRIVAIRSDRKTTEMARRFAWAHEPISPDLDPRITVLHESAPVALRAVPEFPFDVVIAISDPAATTAGASEFTREFYEIARNHLSAEGIFCQRFRQQDLGAESLKQVMSTAMAAFRQVVAIQTTPGEMVLLAGNGPSPFLGEHVLTRLQQDYIRREIATAGWDWTQVAILPMLDTQDPVGVFSQQPPATAISIANSRLTLELPFEVLRSGDRSLELQTSLAPFQLRLAEAIPPGEAHQEIKRRLSLVAQQVEILAGMPDEPWTYRRSLRTEMQRNPRPPKEVISNRKVVRVAHPTDQLQQDYFLTLGQSLQKVLKGDQSPQAFHGLVAFSDQYEPLLSLFAHYELVRLHEMAGHPSPADEYRHRLHTVFFTEQSDASVRPVIAAIQQLTDHPELMPDAVERFDLMNSMLQELIERWEARTAWEPRSASVVQTDVEQSILATHRAVEKLDEWAPAVSWSLDELLRRRRFINAALISPLRQYRDQVLAHRIRTAPESTSDGQKPDDLPLLLNPTDLATN